MHNPTDRIVHTTAFVTPVVEHWLEWEIAQWVHPMKDRSDDPSHHERTLLPQSYSQTVVTSSSVRKTFACAATALFWLAAKILLHAPSHRQVVTCRNLCYTSRVALAAMSNDSMGLLWGIDLMTYHTMSGCTMRDKSFFILICVILLLRMNDGGKCMATSNSSPPVWWRSQF